MTTTSSTRNGRSLSVYFNRAAYAFSRRWLLTISLFIGIFIGLPWLAPLFMAWGWTGAADAIYLFYSTQCHQMPQRSFFLFGERIMYSLPTIQMVWQDSTNPLILRQFNGAPTLGWKVAWSDRMVYMYTALFVAGLLYWPLRRRLKPLPWWALVLFLLPLGIDGLTHTISDLIGGIGGGFRYNNAWLASLTRSAFPATFYTGDVLGSFNSWMRLISGLLFGIGVVWFAYPYLHAMFNDTAEQIAKKLQQKEVGLEMGDAS